MATRKKPEGVESLVKMEPVPLHEMTLLDLFAAFIALKPAPHCDPAEDARDVYDQAEAMIRERARRL
jgi:hypothetical protein